MSLIITALALIILVILSGIALYALTLGLAIICAVFDCHKKRRHGTLCSRCGQYQVYGKYGERVCTNCGVFEPCR